MNVVVTNDSSNMVAQNGATILSYDEFIKRAFSDEGLELESLAIDVDCLSNDEIYEQLSDFDGIVFFTTNGSNPDFINFPIQNWAKPQTIQNETAQQNAQFQNQSRQQIPQPQIQTDFNNQQSVTNDSFSNSEINPSIGDETNQGVANLLENAANYDDSVENDGGDKYAKIYVFGSSKGGTGKTFTSIISTYRYAKTHPDEKIALVDFDIIDGQVGISIHRIKPTISKYYIEYRKGYRDFKTMHNFAVLGNGCFPKNVDFYLAPTTGIIPDNDFWLNVLQNCIENYDVVVFDTGIDYLNIVPISYAYKIADKVNIVSSTSIKSVNSVVKQLGRLKGEIKSPGNDENGNPTEWVFTPEDDIGSKLNVIITQMVSGDQMNKTVYETLHDKANIVGVFGIITASISRAEFFGEWDVFDNNTQINQTLDNIMK